MVAPDYSYEPSDVVFSEAPMGLEIEPSSWYDDSSCVGYDADHDSLYHRFVRRMEEMEHFPEWLAERIAIAKPRHISELSDQQWDELVWSCSSMPPPNYHFQPPSPPYPIQEPSPYQPYYQPSLEPSYQPSFQEPYQQLCSLTSPIETSPHGLYNPCEAVNPVEEESQMLQEILKLMQELNGRLQSFEHKANLARAEVLEAEAPSDNGEPVECVLEQLEGGQVMVSEASDDEDSDTEIVYEEPMPMEEVHIPCIIPSMAKVLSEPLDPMSDLFAEFPELRELDSQSGFPCTDCVGDSLCSACAEIEEAIQGKPVDLGVSLACPTQLHCDHSELEVGEANTPWDHGSTTEGISSTEEVLRVDIPKGEKLMDRLLFPITYRFSSLVPSLPLLTWRMPSIDPPPPQHVPFLGRYEYAYLKNDAQLKDLCAWGTEDLIEANGDRAYKKPLCGSSRSSSLGVNMLWNVRTKRRPRGRRHAWKFPRHGSQKLHGFKDHDMVYIVWDPGGERPSKPWWELQDQFKHKPP